MNTGDGNKLMLRLQTISECLRAQPVTSPAHSIGKPDVSATTTNISVRFAATLPLPLQINKRLGKRNKNNL